MCEDIHTCQPSTREAVAGRLSRPPSQKSTEEEKKSNQLNYRFRPRVLNLYFSDFWMWGGCGNCWVGLTVGMNPSGSCPLAQSSEIITLTTSCAQPKDSKCIFIVPHSSLHLSPEHIIIPKWNYIWTTCCCPSPLSCHLCLIWPVWVPHLGAHFKMEIFEKWELRGVLWIAPEMVTKSSCPLQSCLCVCLRSSSTGKRLLLSWYSALPRVHGKPCKPHPLWK